MNARNFAMDGLLLELRVRHRSANGGRGKREGTRRVRGPAECEPKLVSNKIAIDSSWVRLNSSGAVAISAVARVFDALWRIAPTGCAIGGLRFANPSYGPARERPYPGG